MGEVDMEFLKKIAVRDRVLVLLALAMSAFALLHAWLVQPNPVAWDVASSVSLGPLLFLDSHSFDEKDYSCTRL
jgi:hypothetical protein